MTLALLPLGFRSSHAAWPRDPAINVPLSAAALDQSNPTSVTDGAGGAIVAWRDSRTVGNLDIYAQHVLVSGVADGSWPVDGRVLCGTAGTQNGPAITTDGAGGAIVAWEDGRSGNNDIYAQHVQASGFVDPAWPTDGRAVCTASSDQQDPRIVSDGAGGAIVCWHDQRGGNYDIYAQHVLASGAVDGAWPVDGRALCTAANDQLNTSIVEDGTGGGVVAWQDVRNGSNQDVYAQHVLAAGTVDGSWPMDGRALCTASGNQISVKSVADGAAGAIVTWQDTRGGTFDIYAQHVLASGAVDGAWPVDGRALCTAAFNQLSESIASDGDGGAIITWQDLRGANYDIYAQHVLARGVTAWPFDGRSLCTASGHQQGPMIVSDGVGGAIVSWSDDRTLGNRDIYAQHVLASGTVDPGWPANGRSIGAAVSTQDLPTIVPDGAGGAIVAWQDHRSATYDIYAQRVSAQGYLGAEPAMISVRDVPNDNGGKVKVSWTSSYLDTEVPYVVDHYWIFRSAPPAAALVAGGARPLAASGVSASAEGVYFTTTAGATIYWEYVTSVPATHFASAYGYTAATTSDSMAAGNPKTAFIVVAYSADNATFLASNPDSGYSVDNVPPILPGPMEATATAEGTRLRWEPCADADFERYQLHRGTFADFVPGPENLIAAPREPEYLDTGPPSLFYKLSAVDRHGNESDYAVLAPSGTSGLPLPRQLSLGRPAPNPAGALATMRLALPHASRVTLVVHDVAGRDVRGLIAEALPAGEREVAWDLRDASGARVADGIYFLKLAVEGRTITRRIAVVH